MSGAGESLATKSRYKPPENFFPVVVDNFFNDPEILIDYGKSLPKKPDPDGQWPGKRTEQLWKINEALHSAILSKILSCYFDLEYIEISWSNSSMTFQEIPRFSENKNDIRNKGWIHTDIKYDDSGGQDELAGLIYLTPNIDLDSGTSLFNIKTTLKEHAQFPKIWLYKDDHFDREEYTKSYIQHEEIFLEKTRFQNIFNRLITYDTGEWHRANNFYNGDGKDARLTLAFFVGGINEHPLKRIKSNRYESIIKRRCIKTGYRNWTLTTTN